MPDLDPNAMSYRPVLTLFAVTFLIALDAAHVATDRWLSGHTVEWLVAFTLSALDYLKLRDIESFSTMFLNYDLLARRYSYLDPYGETGAGLLMIPAGGSGVPLGFRRAAPNQGSSRLLDTKSWATPIDGKGAPRRVEGEARWVRPWPG